LILAVFKYYNFFIGNFNGIAELIGWNYSLNTLSILLPIGLSFHTFQSLSYVVEVYRGHQKAERHFGIYSLYVMFYPQLVAGPIERPQNVLHQFREKHSLNYLDVSKGMQRIVWGMFKKVVIADNLAQFVTPVYEHAGVVSWMYLSSKFIVISAVIAILLLVQRVSWDSDSWKISSCLTVQPVWECFGRSGTSHFLHGSEITSIFL
jgi:D-alanyl-lipoteichoic acid acyltransferase DltB (MBOAT superfamily)